MAAVAEAERFPPIPLETVRAARAALGRDDRVAPFMTLGDALAEIFAGVEIARLARRSIAVPPHALAVATLLQCTEGLPDPGVVEALRARASWRYALRLGNDGRAPDGAALRGFRLHLLEDRGAARAFGGFLARVAASPAGMDLAPLPSSTATLVDAVQTLNLLALALRAMRVAGNALGASRSPDARGVFPAEFRERYLSAPYWPSLPRDLAARESYALAVAEDGFVVIDAARHAFDGSEGDPPPEVDALRRTWEWLFDGNGPFVGWRRRPLPPR